MLRLPQRQGWRLDSRRPPPELHSRSIVIELERRRSGPLALGSPGGRGREYLAATCYNESHGRRNLGLSEVETAGRKPQNAGETVDGIAVPRIADGSGVHCLGVPRRLWGTAEAARWRHSFPVQSFCQSKVKESSPATRWQGSRDRPPRIERSKTRSEACRSPETTDGREKEIGGRQGGWFANPEA